MVALRQDGEANYATAITFIFVDAFCLLLRALSKSKTKHGLQSDDWWIVSALIFTYVWVGLIIYSVKGIAGTLEVETLTDLSKIERIYKILWIASLIFPPAITSIKISVLCFYRSIFVTKPFRYTTYTIQTLCILWLFIGFWIIVYQCRPVRAVYDLSLAGEAKCIPFGNFVFAYEFCNAILDVSILLLPVFAIRNLHMDSRRKWGVYSIFMMGGFVLITCVLRMVYSYNPSSPQAVPSFSRGILWSTIELGVAYISACLPTYLPLVPKKFFLTSTIKKWYASLLGTRRSEDQKTGGSSSDTIKPSVLQYKRFDGSQDDWTDRLHYTEAVGGHKEPGRHDVPLRGIAVESQVDVV